VLNPGLALPSPGLYAQGEHNTKECEAFRNIVAIMRPNVALQQRVEGKKRLLHMLHAARENGDDGEGKE
jgi:hypothetical protein